MIPIGRNRQLFTLERYFIASYTIYLSFNEWEPYKMTSHTGKNDLTDVLDAKVIHFDVLKV